MMVLLYGVGRTLNQIVVVDSLNSTCRLDGSSLGRLPHFVMTYYTLCFTTPSHVLASIYCYTVAIVLFALFDIEVNKP